MGQGRAGHAARGPGGSGSEPQPGVSRPSRCSGPAQPAWHPQQNSGTADSLGSVLSHVLAQPRVATAHHTSG